MLATSGLRSLTPDVDEINDSSLHSQERRREQRIERGALLVGITPTRRYAACCQAAYLKKQRQIDESRRAEVSPSFFRLKSLVMVIIPCLSPLQTKQPLIDAPQQPYTPSITHPSGSNTLFPCLQYTRISSQCIIHPSPTLRRLATWHPTKPASLKPPFPTSPPAGHWAGEERQRSFHGRRWSGLGLG